MPNDRRVNRRDFFLLRELLRGVRLLVVLLIASVAVVTLAPPAAAYHEGFISYYFVGSLTSGEGRSTDSPCDHNYATGASWTQGAGAYGTVAVIAPSGSWLASERSNTGGAFTSVSPSNSDADKSHCKNSTAWQVTVTFDCQSWIARAHGTCI